MPTYSKLSSLTTDQKKWFRYPGPQGNHYFNEVDTFVQEFAVEVYAQVYMIEASVPHKRNYNKNERNTIERRNAIAQIKSVLSEIRNDEQISKDRIMPFMRQGQELEVDNDYLRAYQDNLGRRNPLNPPQHNPPYRDLTNLALAEGERYYDNAEEYGNIYRKPLADTLNEIEERIKTCYGTVHLYDNYSEFLTCMKGLYNEYDTTLLNGLDKLFNASIDDIMRRFVKAQPSHWERYKQAQDKWMKEKEKLKYLLTQSSFTGTYADLSEVLAIV